MNANASIDELKSGGIRILCPVCQKKLKQNLKFDSKERIELMSEVTEELGFYQESKIYSKLLKGLKNACIAVILDDEDDQTVERKIKEKKVKRKATSVKA